MLTFILSRGMRITAWTDRSFLFLAKYAQNDYEQLSNLFIMLLTSLLCLRSLMQCNPFMHN